MSGERVVQSGPNKGKIQYKDKNGIVQYKDAPEQSKGDTEKAAGGIAFGFHRLMRALDKSKNKGKTMSK